jgi:lincosamide nucleotidyltransferase A/C/D/E
MELDQVLAVLDALDRAGVPHWVEGGWGVDILVGRQTRDHRDVDVDVDARALPAALAALAALGFVVRTDELPTRVELAGPAEQWVDVHPIELTAEGDGRQVDPAGGWFTFPAACFTSAVIAGRRVGCISAATQLDFHTGYPPRPVDQHDITLLRGLCRDDTSRARP